MIENQRNATSPRTREAPPCRVVLSNKDGCLGSVANFVVAHWFLNTEGASVRMLSDLLRSTAARYPAGIALVQVIADQAAPPDSEVRRMLVEMLQTGPAAVKGSSIVVPGQGFRVAAARALVSGLARLSRAKFPHVVHATVHDSVQWHLKALQGAAAHDAPQIVSGIEALPKLPVR